MGRLIIETDSATIHEAECADQADMVPGNYALLTVSDDGCGMAPQTMSNLFEPFFTTKDVGQGTGLGLATVYGIVKQNKGSIQVSSEPGRGTTFRIYLPAFQVAESRVAPEQAADYRLLDVNPAFERITGIPRSWAIGTLASALYGMGQAPFLDIYSKVAETGEPASFEAYFAPLQKHLFVTVGSPGPGKFSTVFSDVTDIVRAQEALRDSESRFRLLVESSPDAIFVQTGLRFLSRFPPGRFIFRAATAPWCLSGTSPLGSRRKRNWPNRSRTCSAGTTSRWDAKAA